MVSPWVYSTKDEPNSFYVSIHIQLLWRMAVKTQMVLVEVAVAGLADLVTGATDLEEEGEEEGVGGKEEEMETMTTQKEEGSSQEVAGEVEVVNALTMGTVRREGEEGKEGDLTVTVLMVAVEIREKVRQTDQSLMYTN